MYNDWFYLEQSRVMRERELTKRMAERRQYAQLKAGRPSRTSPRARLARCLFALAVVTERRETWEAVWERLESRGRL